MEVPGQLHATAALTQQRSSWFALDRRLSVRQTPFGHFGDGTTLQPVTLAYILLLWENKLYLQYRWSVSFTDLAYVKEEVQVFSICLRGYVTFGFPHVNNYGFVHVHEIMKWHLTDTCKLCEVDFIFCFADRASQYIFSN